MMPFISNHAIGITLWGTSLGTLLVWFICEIVNAKRDDEIWPDPQPDARDKMAEWRRIMEENET